MASLFPGKALERLVPRTKISVEYDVPRVGLPSEAEEFVEFARGKGFELNPVQRYWAARVFQRKGYALNMLTGYGKTTFLTLLAAFASSRGERVLYVTASETEKREVERRLGELGAEVTVVNAASMKELEAAAKKEWDWVLADDTDFLFSDASKKANLIILAALSCKEERCILSIPSWNSAEGNRNPNV